MTLYVISVRLIPRASSFTGKEDPSSSEELRQLAHHKVNGKYLDMIVKHFTLVGNGHRFWTFWPGLLYVLIILLWNQNDKFSCSHTLIILSFDDNEEHVIGTASPVIVSVRTWGCDKGNFHAFCVFCCGGVGPKWQCIPKVPWNIVGHSQRTWNHL